MASSCSRQWRCDTGLLLTLCSSGRVEEAAGCRDPGGTTQRRSALFQPLGGWGEGLGGDRLDATPRLMARPLGGQQQTPPRPPASRPRPAPGVGGPPLPPPISLTHTFFLFPEGLLSSLEHSTHVDFITTLSTLARTSQSVDLLRGPEPRLASAVVQG